MDGINKLIKAAELLAVQDAICVFSKEELLIFILARVKHIMEEEL